MGLVLQLELNETKKSWDFLLDFQSVPHQLPLCTVGHIFG